jgi:hypothetical protein
MKNKLGAIGFSSSLLQDCAVMLDGIATLDRIEAGQDGAWRGEGIGLLLIVLNPPLPEALAAFSMLRRQYPLVPLLVLAERVDANFAAELLKCGAEDFLLLPPSPSAFRHKIKRALGEVAGPAFDSAEFAAFKPRDFDENQRHCFRVTVPPDFPVASFFPGPVDRPLEVKDLSIETEKAPGGMQVAADRATARRLPFDQWNRRREIELTVQLPAGSPIATRARLIPGLRLAPDGSIRFAVEYWATRPAEKERFRRYWVEAQRRMCRARK